MNSIGFLALLLVTSVALDTGMYARIEQASLRSSHDLGVKMNVRFIVKVFVQRIPFLNASQLL